MSLFVTLSTSAALYSSLKLWFDVPFAIVMRFPKIKGNPKEIWFLQLSQWILVIAVLCRSYFLVFLWARNVNRCLVLRLPLLCHMTLVKTEQQMEAFTFNASLTTTLFLICSVSCSFGENSAHSWICPARASCTVCMGTQEILPSSPAWSFYSQSHKRKEFHICNTMLLSIVF